MYNNNVFSYLSSMDNHSVVFFSIEPPERVFPGYPLDLCSTHWITRKGTLPGISHCVFSQNSL